MVVMAMNVQGQQTAADHRPEIDDQKLRLTQKELYRRAEEEEADHVEDQVPPVRVEKPRSHQPVIFLSPQDAFRIENIFGLDLPVSESEIGNDPGRQDHQVIAHWSRHVHVEAEAHPPRRWAASRRCREDGWLAARKARMRSSCWSISASISAW